MCVGSVSVGGEVAHTLFDTGDSHSFVSSRLAKSWPFQGVFEPKLKQILTAGTERLGTTGVHRDVPVLLGGADFIYRRPSRDGDGLLRCHTLDGLAVTASSGDRLHASES